MVNASARIIFVRRNQRIVEQSARVVVRDYEWHKNEAQDFFKAEEIPAVTVAVEGLNCRNWRFVAWFLYY